MRRIRHLALLGVAAAVSTLTVAGCTGSVTAPGTGERVVVPAAAASATPAGTPGTACAGVPAEEPVVQAMSHSSALSTLSAALRTLPALTRTLTTEPSLTVYAPADEAFDELRATMGGPAFDALMADPERLDGLLSYPVTLKRYDARGLVAAGKTTQLAYGDVTVHGEPASFTLTSTGGTEAGVLCADVPTVNATVFVVDRVLVPAT